MTINQTKSKVIHFRCKRTKQTVSNFKCGDIGLDLTSEYKYLGLWFNEFSDLQGIVKHVAKSAIRALGAVIYLSSNGQVVYYLIVISNCLTVW